METSSTASGRIDVTGRETGWTEDRGSEALERTTGGAWKPPSSFAVSSSVVASSVVASSDSSIHHSITAETSFNLFNEATTDVTESSPTYSTVLFTVVWVFLTVVLVILLCVAIATLIVRCRRAMVRRRPKNPENKVVTFRFTRSSNLLLDRKQKPKSSPTSSREVLSHAAEVPAFTGTGNSLTVGGAGQGKVSESDLYEKDSDRGSWHLECTTFSAVNDNFDVDKIDQR